MAYCYYCRSLFVVFIASCLIGSLHVHADDDLTSERQLIYGDNGRYQQDAYSFVVGIVIPTTDGRKSQVCSGSLITSTHVLTAAHCFEGISDGRLRKATIYLNTQRLESDSPGVIIRGPKNLIVHQGFDPKKSVNNIAIMSLNEPVKGVPFARLESARHVVQYNRRLATVIGWGSNDRQTEQTRKTSRLSIITNKECSKIAKFRMETSDLCSMTSYSHRGPSSSSSCEGDDGGPIIVDGVQVGIKGLGLEDRYCGKPGSVAVNTRVSSYVEWIATKTGQRVY